MRSILVLLLSFLQPGPHDVGYRVEGAASVWYPADTNGEVMRYRDYVPKLEDADAFLHSMKISDETIVGLFDTRMAARRGAAPKPGRFPIVLIFQGNGQNASDQAVLTEHLASHGYVVATLPAPVIEAESEMGAKAQEQAQAFGSLVRKLKGDPGNVSVIGHSFGARSMLLFAMHHPTRAMISLDGGIGTATGIDVLRAAPWFDAKRRLPPILHLYQELDAFMKPDPAFLRSLRAKSLTMERVDGLHHAHFTTWGYAAAAFPELAKATRATGQTHAGLERVAQRVVDFLKTRQ